MRQDSVCIFFYGLVQHPLIELMLASIIISIQDKIQKYDVKDKYMEKLRGKITIKKLK